MKTCFRCNKQKPLSEYYAHKMMADGTLNKCKECTKSDSAKRHEVISSTPELAIKERQRQRLKERKRRALGLTRKYPRASYSQRSANTYLSNAIRDKRITRKPCEICGCVDVQGHHEDYSKPLLISWLCVRHHNDRHIYLRECSALMMTPMSISDFISANKE